MFPGRRKVYIVFFFFFLGSHERSAAEQFLLLSQGVFTIKIPVLVLCQHFFLQVLGRNPLQSRLFFALVSVEKKEKIIIKKNNYPGKGKTFPNSNLNFEPQLQPQLLQSAEPNTELFFCVSESTDGHCQMDCCRQTNPQVPPIN